jgi:hypothetical protein
MASLFASLVAVCLAAAGAQTTTRPDFTGTWLIDVARSDFGELPVPTVYSLTIVHKEPGVSVARDVNGTKDSSEFRTDGVEVKNDSACCGTLLVTGRWDGATLRRRVVNEALAQSDSWTLSADGKTLTIVREIDQGEGVIKIKMVFGKKS